MKQTIFFICVLLLGGSKTVFASGINDSIDPSGMKLHYVSASVVGGSFLKGVTSPMQDKYSPAESAVEVQEKRTRTSKYYRDRYNTAKFYTIQSIGAINYLKNGQWLTIDERLEDKGNNQFEASRQDEPVGFDIGKQTAYIKSLQGTVYCNQWELYGETNGKDTLLAKPNWSHFTAGDEGLYIINIFPDIDAEMKVGRGTIETNFIIHKNHFTTVQRLLFKDTFGSQSGDTFQKGVTTITNETFDYLINGKPALQINQAVAYEENDAEHSIIMLPYVEALDKPVGFSKPDRFEQQSLSFSIDVSYLNAHLANGNVIIDPLISTTNSLAQADITGSMDCGSATNSCNYTLQVPSPAKTTITGIWFQFGFQTVGTALNKNGYWTISSGTGTTMFGSDPTNPTKYNSPGTTSTQGQFADISATFLSAMPASSCNSQNIPFILGFFNNLCGAGSTCSNNFIKASQPFIVLVEGYTVAVGSITPTVSICKGANTTLNVAGKYGMPPYSYTWSNGAGSTSSVTVAPTVNTSYQVTITDQCGNTANGSVAVMVKPVAAPATPIASSNSPFCEGGTLSLTATSTTGATYAWTGANGFTSNLQNPTKPNADIDATGTYSVTAFAGGCASAPATINVTVNTTKVAVSIQANATTLCEGTLATFTALPTNGGTAPTYQWKVNGSIVGTNSSTFSSTTLKNKDVVTCTMISNAGSCITSAAVTSNKLTLETMQSYTGWVADIDGNNYKTVVIGSQEWMAANLNTTKYNDGTAIPNVTDNTAWSNLTTGAYCNYNNLASNAATYGRLYNWYAVNTGKLCPTGWHVPTNNEWTTLETYLIANGYNYDGSNTDNKIAKSMASTSGWNPSTSIGDIGNNPSTNNKSDFAALPGGSRGYTGTFLGIGNYGVWWSSTEYSASYAYGRSLNYDGSYLLNGSGRNEVAGFSVRCLRNFDLFDYLSISLAAEPLEMCKNESTTLTVKVCSGTAPYSYKWSTGAVTSVPSVTVAPTVSTSYIVTVTDAKGKTNSDTVLVTVKQPSSSTLTKTVCGSYTLNGQTYNTSGTYTQTFTNKAGCDSTVTLNLTVKKPSMYELSRTVCSSYTLNGQTYSTGGTYTQTLTNKADCDSTITLHLTISNNSPTASIITASACDSYTLNGYNYDSTGIYMQMLKNAAGCDSTITLHLTITKSTQKSITASVCGSYLFNGTTYTASGIYKQYLTNKAGCDSIVTLQLTIDNSKPAVSIKAVVAAFCPDTLVNFTATPVNGGSKPSYRWMVNGLTVGSDSSAFSTSRLTLYDEVTCGMISNAGGCIPATEITSNAISLKSIGLGVQATDIEGYTYKTVTIGKQVWMAENLRTTKYNDGTVISNITDATVWSNLSTGAWCNYNNDASNAATYGRLYNWYAVNTGKLCPTGWHVPSNDEWNTLEAYLTDNGYGYGGSGDDIAKSLASITGWSSYTDIGTIGNNPSTNNKSGFAALPGGYRNNNGTFFSIGNYGRWWSSTVYGIYGAYYRTLNYDYSYLYFNTIVKVSGFSVRCLRNFDILGNMSASMVANTPKICNGNGSVLDVAVCSGTAPFSYTWSTGAVTAMPTLTVNPVTTTSYSVTVTDANSKSATASATVTVLQPTASIITASACDSYTLNGQTYTASATYTQTLTNKAGCDSIITLNLTIKQPSISSITQSACDSFTLNDKTYNTSGIYTQTITNKAGCDSTITIHLKILASTTSITKANICKGNSYSFNGNSYTTEGTYSAHLSNVAGCDSVAMLEINLISPPIAQDDSSKICLNDNIPILTASISGSVDSVVWFDNQYHRLSNGTTFQPQSVSQTGIYTYYYIPYKNGCVGNEAAYYFHVSDKPSPDIAGLREQCNGAEKQIYTLTNPINGSINWDIDDVEQRDYTNQSTARFNFSHTGTHIVKVSESVYGCTGSDTLTVFVSDIPQADFTVTVQTDTLVALFNNMSSEVLLNGTSLPNTYQWSFATDSIKTFVRDMQFTHIFAGDGDYSVTLWATNSYGCKDSITKIVTLSQEPMIMVPTGFSPNGDGLNDVLYAVGSNIEDIDFMIFDRWGEKVFESLNLADGWDGTFKGKPLDAATFMYSITAWSKTDGNKITKKGTITLVR